MTKKTNVISLRDYAVKSRLANFNHEIIVVPEWDDSKVICKALSAGDWYDYHQLAKELGALTDDPNKERDANVNPLEFSAFAFIRGLYDPETEQRVFTDKDRKLIVDNYSPVHDRLATKIFELSKLKGGEQEDLKKD